MTRFERLAQAARQLTERACHRDKGGVRIWLSAFDQIDQRLITLGQQTDGCVQRQLTICLGLQGRNQTIDRCQFFIIHRCSFSSR